MGFKQYKDPIRAEHVWREYEPELSSFGLENQGRGAIEESEDSVGLEAKLSLILEIYQKGRTRGGRSGPLDEDAGGYHSIARRILEDG